MIRIATIIGARPQFIKAAAISRAIAAHNKVAAKGLPHISEILIHTGQHYDYEMSAVFFEELGLGKPAYHLDVGSNSHCIQTAKILEKLEEPLVKIKPDVVLVYGDTNSTLAGALTAAKLNLPVAHIEAGLRSFNRRMPEELNRVIVDHLSHWLFSPSNLAVQNLKKEGIQKGVYLVGDIMYDVCLWHQKSADRHRNLLLEFGLYFKSYALATVHRAGNTDDSEQLRSIFRVLEKIASDIMPVILPLHPRTKNALHSFGIAVDRVKIIPPVSYEQMLFLEKNAQVILTDSGGMQKEAYWLGIPCVTLREETEWVETVELGWNVLARAEEDFILEALQRKPPDTERPQLYGDGKASKAIINSLVKDYCLHFRQKN